MQQNAVILQDAQTLEARLNTKVLENLVLLRLLFGAQEGETEVQLRKDLHPLVMQQMSAGEWRTVLGQLIVRLVDEGLMRPVRANAYMHNEQCSDRILSFLKVTRLPKLAWHEIRDGHLIALALGLAPTTKLVARLSTAEGLRSAILTKHFNLPFEISTVTTEQIRQGLAAIAEKRGLTAGIRTTPIEEKTLTHKEAVMMGAKLLKSGHVVESDGELMACLAAEVAGAMNESASELRQILFRRLISTKESTVMGQTQSGRNQSQAGELNSDVTALGEAPPELPEFTSEVKQIAANSAVGWPGNKRAFISHVWRDLRAKFPLWNLNEEEFKEMILNAQRAGLLRLAIADLRDKNNVKDVADSRISYKNSEWHFIRVEDSNE